MKILKLNDELSLRDKMRYLQLLKEQNESILSLKMADKHHAVACDAGGLTKILQLLTKNILKAGLCEYTVDIIVNCLCEVLFNSFKGDKIFIPQVNRFFISQLEQNIDKGVFYLNKDEV